MPYTCVLLSLRMSKYNVLAQKPLVKILMTTLAQLIFDNCVHRVEKTYLATAVFLLLYETVIYAIGLTFKFT